MNFNIECYISTCDTDIVPIKCLSFTKFLLVVSFRVRFKVSWYLLFDNCEHAICSSSITQKKVHVLNVIHVLVTLM